VRVSRARGHPERQAPHQRHPGRRRPSAEALGHEQLAAVAAAGHDHQRAWDAYGTAIALAREAGDPVLEVRCYLGFGAVALALGNDDEATRFSEAARDHAWEEIYRQHTLLEGIPERTQLRSVVGIAYCSTSRVRRSVCCGRLNP